MGRSKRERKGKVKRIVNFARLLKKKLAAWR